MMPIKKGQSNFQTMTTKTIEIVVLLMLAVIKQCDAFQPHHFVFDNNAACSKSMFRLSAYVDSSGGGPTSSSQLRYQEDKQIEDNYNGMSEFDKQSLMYSQTTIENNEEQQEEGENFYSTTFDEEDDIYHEDMYNEDGSIYVPVNPTLELLQQWTQEYIDAVDLAGGGITRLSVNVENLMADEYVFTSPTIGPINKSDFVQLMRFYLDCGFDIASAVPDFKTHYDGWHQDPHEPWRIWAVVRYSGTHTGVAVVPQAQGLKLTPPNDGDHPEKFMTGPELHSFLWTPDKKMLWQTLGYIGDPYTGSNQGKGGLQGLMVSLGLPTLYLDSTAPLRKSMAWFSQFSDNGKEPRSKSPYSSLPQWWHDRKLYDMNIHR